MGVQLGAEKYTMKKYFPITLVILACSASLAIGGAEILSFYAFPALNHCQLEWQSGIETDMNQYTIERSSDGEVFGPVGQVSAQGSFSQYNFTDRSPLLADIERTFYYRLKIVDRNGNFSYSEVREVSLTFSAVQHTWGSIKAMFR